MKAALEDATKHPVTDSQFTLTQAQALGEEETEVAYHAETEYKCGPRASSRWKSGVTGNWGSYSREFPFSVTFTLPAGYAAGNELPVISFEKV